MHLACQAEYGTGVRAGSLDQATEQKGRAGQGTLISSNPRDNYRILGTYPVPAERFQILFPYSVERDRKRLALVLGRLCASSHGGSALTTGETRKMTGKAAEFAALLTAPAARTRLLQTDRRGPGLGRPADPENRAWICSPSAPASRFSLTRQSCGSGYPNRAWYACQFVEIHRLGPRPQPDKADATLHVAVRGWRDPFLRRTYGHGGYR